MSADDLLDSQGRPLDLAEPAATSARLLRKRFPDVIFTSGRRDLAAQARAMAQNVALCGRSWLRQTYKPSKALDALAAWLERHSQARTWPGIAAGFLGVLRELPAEEVAKLSRHLGGLAFDVKPVAGAAGEAIKAQIRALPHLELFLDHEGGLVRWHAQFQALTEVDANANNDESLTGAAA